MARLLENKIQDLRKLKKLISYFKARRKKIVFTNGCFDLLHYGHVKYLQDARRKGDVLVVGINSDASVKMIKGEKRPVVNERDRLRLVASLESVDYVVLFKEDTPLKIIRLIKPDVLVKGADWNRKNIVGKDFVISNGGRVSTIKFVKGYSTSDLIKKIAKHL
ncbi:MAG: D-glycero-beta-D-manno-heptose 1-phosphate adenylyltransferase [Candidatus Omnitrophota bacterium]|nr:D-glycero-beta-D-manno-heptose 1-phosphate adenylyltransferase [Candidatus Omnitrophota bacterium]